MVFVKLINGKRYGPYYYENRRVGKKIITTYHGKNRPLSHELSSFSSNSYRQYFFLFGVILFIILAGSFIYFSFSPTGRATLAFDESVQAGELLDGKLTLGLEPDEFLPADTQVVVSLGDVEKTFALSELVSNVPVSGTYYASGTALFGEGRGYGAGTETSYPEVSFELIISKGESGGAEGGNAKAEQKGQEAKEESNKKEEKPKEGEMQLGEEKKDLEKESEKKELEKSEEIKEEKKEEIKGSESKAEETTAEAVATESGEQTITGAVVAGNEESVSGSVRKDKEFTYSLEAGERASLKSGSVKIEGKSVDDGKVQVSSTDGKVIVTTGYETYENSSESVQLEIDLSRFNLTAEEGTLNVRVIAQGSEIVSVSEEIEVEEQGTEAESEEQTEIISNVTNDTIGNLTSVNLTLDETNVTANITVLGNATIGNATVKTSRAKIRVGERVKWVKNVTLERAENATIELPKEAENVSVRKVDERTQETSDAVAEVRGITGSVIHGDVTADIELSKERGFMNLVRGLFGGVTGRAITEGNATAENVANATAGTEANTGENASVEVHLSDNATSYTIEYYTEAPVANEENLSNGKRVVISGPDALGYTDVESFATIEERFAIGQESRIRVRWEEGKQSMAFTALDTDGNGKLDYVEWITPHLSNQTFTIILITKAEHLDADREFIEDVTESAKTLDGNYTPVIPAGHYVRAVFETNLTNKKDITLYARSPNGGSVQVYEKDSEVLLADFGAFGTERERKQIFLTNLSESYDNETEILTLEKVDCAVVNCGAEGVYCVNQEENKEEVGDTPTSKALSVMQTLAESNVNINSNYLNFSVDEGRAGYAPEALLVMRQSNKLSPRGIAGSTPVWGDPALSDSGKKCYVERWKLFRDLRDGEKVMTLNQETGESEWQVPKDRQEFDNKGKMYLIALDDGSEMRVSEKHKVYVSYESGVISNLSSYTIISLPSNSFGFTSSSTLEKAGMNDSGLSCEILNQTTENTLSEDNLIKSQSFVINTLFSNLENSANLPLERPFGLDIMSNPCCLRNTSNLLLTFSSLRNLGERDDDTLGIFSTPHETGCVLQGSFDVFRSERREIFNNLIYSQSSLEHLQNLPDHDPRAFEGWLAVANLTVCDNVFVDFNSHTAGDRRAIYNSFGLRPVRDVVQDIRKGRTAYFMDADGGAIGVKSIEHVPYSGKLYDVDVDNDIVLVRRQGGTELWSGNSDTSYSQDTFDLRVSGGEVEFDWIVDPASSYNLTFVPPTPANGSGQPYSNVTINVSLNGASDLQSFIWNWNGTNYTMYNDSLVLMMNFDNVGAIGDNETHVKDVSKYGNNGTLVGGATYNVSGKYGGAGLFDGVNDYVRVDSSPTHNIGASIDFTISAWVNTNSSGGAIIDRYPGGGE